MIRVLGARQSVSQTVSDERTEITLEVRSRQWLWERATTVFFLGRRLFRIEIRCLFDPDCLPDCLTDNVSSNTVLFAVKPTTTTSSGSLDCCDSIHETNSETFVSNVAEQVQSLFIQFLHHQSHPLSLSSSRCKMWDRKSQRRGGSSSVDLNWPRSDRNEENV